MGQELGVPIWKLLGGCFRDRVPAYANGWYQADFEPARIAELARDVVARGYRAMKLDPFGAASVRLSASDRRRAIAVVAAVRDAIGPDISLMIEMHGRFSPDTAAGVAVALEAYDPRWLEEPVPPENAAALSRVRRATTAPIATGERIHSIWDAAPFVEGGDIDIVQADLTHFGGFTGMRRLAGLTEAHYLTLAPHNVGGPVATMANVHLAVATRNVDILEHFNDFADPWLSELVDAAPTVDPVDGCFALPDRPGLGVRLDHDACARHPRTGGRLQLFVEGWQKREGG
jgi:galactonate dehydratase